MNRPYFCPENWKGYISVEIWVEEKRTIIKLGTLHSVYFCTGPEGLVKKSGMQSPRETMLLFFRPRLPGNNRFDHMGAENSRFLHGLWPQIRNQVFRNFSFLVPHVVIVLISAPHVVMKILNSFSNRFLKFYLK